MKLKDDLFSAIIKVLVWTLISLTAAVFFINKQFWVGPVILVIGVAQVFSLQLFGIPPSRVWPDVVFGIIDNGVLVIFALAGASFFGVLGAIVGGAVGNAITDGLAGIFEGHTAKTMKKNGIRDARTPISTAIGKMAGCMIGAGAVLTVAWTLLGIAT